MTPPEDPRSPRIGAAEAARRLGVKTDTLYAYVSRGYLARRTEPDRRSSFDLAEVEALRDTGARDRGQQARPFRFPVITTRLTHTGDGRLRYRGHDATDLARTASFEEVAGLLWTGRVTALPMHAPSAILRAVRAVLDATPAVADTGARLRLAAVAAEAADPGRLDLQPVAVRRCGSVAVAVLVAAAGADGDDGPVADRLWSALRGPEADARLEGFLSAALVLLADHGLAASTVTARAAASARANPYGVISAGLAALEGPLHGAADATVHRFLVDASTTRRLADVVSAHRHPDGTVPGFSDRSPTDPRATALLHLLRDSGAATTVLDTVDALARFDDRAPAPHATVELALGALAAAAGMSVGATGVITAVARTAGWIAHALEEYAEPPLRWRAREIYTGA